MSNTKKLLNEVSIMRPLAIFLLVVMHSFTIYGIEGHPGGWKALFDVEIPAYYYLAKIITGFRIETIALIAGYVFAYQSIDLHRNYSFKDFAWKKFKRLLVPCYVFGIFYYFILLFQQDSFTMLGFLNAVFDGAGHLWFLPMLFWCFLGLWFIDRLKWNELFLLVGLFGLSILPVPYLPFGLSRASSFLFFAYGGYALYKHKDSILNKLCTWRIIVCLVCLYGLSLWGQLSYNHLYKTILGGGVGFIDKVIILVTCKAISNIVSIFGAAALYLVVSKFTERPKFKPKQWIIWSSSICYGVYVYHQFILRFLYFKTSLPSFAGPYALPWIALTITLILSVGLTVISLKTKIGRFLIG